MTDLWLGRVFLRGDRGGNHTAVVSAGVPANRRQAVATLLDVPDTGFVVGSHERRVVLRSHSPSEEISHCLQTSLAAVVAAGAVAGETWAVSHEIGSALLARVDPDEPAVVWVSDQPPSEARPLGSDANESVPLGDQIAGRLGRPTAVAVRTARPRLYVTGVAPSDLEAFDAAPHEVLQLCRETGTSGLVLGGPATTALRVRVFTTSLEGREDVATGGAVLELARLLRHELPPGPVRVTQGPRPGSGHLRLRLPGDLAEPIELGAEVRTLVVGTLGSLL